MNAFVRGRAGLDRRRGEESWTGKSKTAYFIIYPPHQKKLGASTKFRKATISFIMSVCPSLPKEQRGSHWKVFHEI
jgi:hypothetical protein